MHMPNRVLSIALLSLLATSLAPQTVAADVTGDTLIMGVFTGSRTNAEYETADEDPHQVFFGTDLGYTFAKKDELGNRVLWILFGDTWYPWFWADAGYDDAQAYIDLDGDPPLMTGAHAQLWYAPPSSDRQAIGNKSPLRLETTSGPPYEFYPIWLYEEVFPGFYEDFDLPPMYAPNTGFVDIGDPTCPDNEGFERRNKSFATFLRYESVKRCYRDSDCGDGLVCNRNLGLCPDHWTTWPSYQQYYTYSYPENRSYDHYDVNLCLPGYRTTWGQGACCTSNWLYDTCSNWVCAPQIQGFCSDPSSSIAAGEDATACPSGDIACHIQSVAREVKIAVSIDDYWYWGQHYQNAENWAATRDLDFYTNKFLAMHAKTVKNFDENTGCDGLDNCKPTTGWQDTDGGDQPAVLFWGRPSYAALNGKKVGTYLMYNDLPISDCYGRIDNWHPRYFVECDDDPDCNNPVWSDRQGDAKPIYDPMGEPDIVSSPTVSYVPGIDKWVMLYGADYPDAALRQTMGRQSGPYYDRGLPTENGIYMRTADHPWGPWSDRQTILVQDELYRSGWYWMGPTGAPKEGPSVLYDEACWGGPVFCDPEDPVPTFPCVCTTNFGKGYLYGANIIDQWNMADGPDRASIYWNVSTWSPYRVLILRTVLDGTP